MLRLVLTLSVISIAAGQCPFGQIPFGPSCYAMSARRDQWNDADNQCGYSGGRLSSMANAFERSTLQTVVSESGITTADYVWIGGNRLDDGTTWKWSDGTDFVFQQWRQGYPTADQAANCVVMEASSGLFMNLNCDLSQYFICKFPQNRPPTSPPPPTVTPYCDHPSLPFFVHFHMDYSPAGLVTENHNMHRAVIHGHQATVNLRVGGPSKFKLSAVARVFGPINTLEDYFDDPLDISAEILTYDGFATVFQFGSDVLNIGGALRYLIANPAMDIPPYGVPIIVLFVANKVNDTGEAIPAANVLKNLDNPYKIMVIANNQDAATSAYQLASDFDSVLVHNGNNSDTIKWMADKSCQYYVNGKKNVPSKLH